MSPWAWSPEFLPRGVVGRVMLLIVVATILFVSIGLAFRLWR